ncbi:MAG: CocE/NonD family hydrolase [Gemmatimonadales bacterium]|nr:CocE/NonD family hydrolase [Gemmatimonadales bacterium]
MTMLQLAVLAAVHASAQTPDAARAAPLRTAVSAVDGSRLLTDVYGAGDSTARRPTILARTPYGKEALRAYGEFFAAKGYVFIAQSVRGTGGSSGQYIPFLNEGADGGATLDWIVARPWSNGRVGMMGPSYLGFCALAVAAARHPALVTLIDNSAMNDLNELLYPGGAFNFMVNLPWTMLFAGPRPAALPRWDTLFVKLPVASLFSGPSAGMAAGYPAFNTRLDDASPLRHLGGVSIPMLHLTGWNDFLYRHTLAAFSTLSTGRARQELIVGPWYHDQQQRTRSTRAGDEEFGPSAGFGPDSLMALELDWFDRYLKTDRADTGPHRSPVRVFVMGANEWKDFDRWPPSGARRQTYYLEPAATLDRSAGRLSQTRPRRASSIRFHYDPNDPVPTVGGVNFHFFTDNLGPKDQRQVEGRGDVLLYQTDPLPRDAEVLGPITARLYVSSDALDADFTAKLVVVRPDGYARIVEDGILRARFRNGRRNPVLLTPGETVALDIDLGSTALRVPAGHRLRLELSGGNFPKYDRNPQTGDNPLSAAKLVKAEHSVWHGGNRASSITIGLRWR